MPSDSNNMKLHNKKAFVTGAGRGIGRGCALELARAGADVVVNDLRPDGGLDTTVAEIKSLGRQCVAVPGDMFDRDSCSQVVEQAIRAFGHLDILVSNPAYSRRETFLNYDPEVFEKVIRGTLVAGFHVSQLVARHLVERGQGGKILFISSVHHRIPFARSVAYNAGKSGLINMAFTVANELAPHRINVNVIEPGWIDTPGEREAFGDAMIDQAGAGQVWGRLGTPADIGRAAAFLCSDDADFITGTSLLVDGGSWLKSAQE